MGHPFLSPLHRELERGIVSLFIAWWGARKREKNTPHSAASFNQPATTIRTTIMQRIVLEFQEHAETEAWKTCNQWAMSTIVITYILYPKINRSSQGGFQF